MKEPRRILVIRRRAVGDLVVSMAVPAALRRRWPDARIDLLADRGPHAAAEGSPHVDEVVVYDRRAHNEAAWWRQPRLAWRWLRGLRERHYDLVLDLMGTPQTAAWTWATRAPLRVGRRRRWRSWAYNQLVEPPAAPRFAGEVFLDWVRALGIDPGPWEPVPLVLEPGQLEAASAAAHALRPGDGPLVALVPGALHRPASAWPLEHFGELARALAVAGARVLVAWGPGEEPRRDSVLRLAGGAAAALPPTQLRELAAWLAACDLVITTDTGPKHIAVAMGTPILGLYGSTNPEGWHPPGEAHRALFEEVPCRPCDLEVCPVAGHPCLDGLAPGRVLQAAREMLGGGGA